MIIWNKSANRGVEMIILKISLFMIGLAIVDRFLQTKQSKDIVNMGVKFIRAIILIIILGAIYLLSYFVTDTLIDFVYVFLASLIFYTLNFVIAKWRGIMLTNFLIIIAIPLFVILYIKAISHILVDMSWILTPILLSGSILTFSNKVKEMNWKNYLSNILGIGLGIGVMLIYFYPFHENNNVIPNKQEVVASQFLKEELNLSASTIYSERKLRGEDTIVRAFSDSDGKLITMIYRYNSIISYEIKDR